MEHAWQAVSVGSVCVCGYKYFICHDGLMARSHHERVVPLTSLPGGTVVVGRGHVVPGLKG